MHDLHESFEQMMIVYKVLHIPEYTHNESPIEDDQEGLSGKSVSELATFLTTTKQTV